jgi:glycosyltransferase involved in cell wall biosynthesis
MWWARTALRSRFGHVVRKPAGPCHALIVAGSFPPQTYGGVHRPVSLMRHGTAFGRRFSVLAGPGPDPVPEAGRYLSDAVPPDLSVVRMRRIPAYWRPRRGWPRIDGGLHNAFALFDAGARAFATNPPNVILATGPPFHVFVAGVYLARYFRVPLVLDFRDEWTQCPFDFVDASGADSVWERRCLEAADRVVFVTRSIHAVYREVYPDLDHRGWRVIPNGWEPDDFPADPAPRPVRGKGLTLSFVGTAGDAALPAAFLEALAAVMERNERIRKGLRVRFVGGRTPAADRQLAACPFPDRLEVVDTVPKDVACAEVCRSDALLLPNEPRLVRALPGKLFTYLASARPVLVYGAGGEAAALVEDLRAGVVIPVGDRDLLERTLDTWIKHPPADDRSTRRTAWLDAHTRKAMTRRFTALLDDLA